MTRAGPPERVPTLTEVVERRPGAIDVPAMPSELKQVAVVGVSPVLPRPLAVDAASESDLAQRLMSAVQLHVDRVLEARVRAALEPVLQQIVARVTEETRRELASTLRDGIARALAQEMSRHRGESMPR